MLDDKNDEIYRENNFSSIVWSARSGWLKLATV